MALIDDYKNIDVNSIEALSNLERIISTYRDGHGLKGSTWGNPYVDRGFSERLIDEAARQISESQGIPFEDAQRAIYSNPALLESTTAGSSPLGGWLQQFVSDAPGLKDALYTTRGVLDDDTQSAFADFLEDATPSWGSRLLPGSIFAGASNSSIADTDTWKKMSEMERIVYLNELIKKFKTNPEEARKILQGHTGRQAITAWENDLAAFKEKQKPEVKKKIEDAQQAVETEIASQPSIVQEPFQSDEEKKEIARQERVADLAAKLATLKSGIPTRNSGKSLMNYTPEWWGAV